MNISLKHPCLFVVGAPRSGTTLLQRMLDHHPHLAVANDTHFIPRCLQKVADIASVLDSGDHLLTSVLIDAVRKYHRFTRLGLCETDVDHAAEESRTYREFVCALYACFAQHHGKPLSGEKTPNYVCHLQLLAVLFPWARFVHIVRDGRDVALSTLQWATETKGPGKLELWKQEPVALSALWWRWMVKNGCRAGQQLPNARYFQVKYEQLVNHPEEELRELSRFLGQAFAPEMVNYHVGKTRRDPGLSPKKAWLPPTPGLRDWRAQMNQRDLELFEVLAGDLLSDLGYERAVSGVPPRVAKVAAQCRTWWESHLARRRHKLARRRAEMERRS